MASASAFLVSIVIPTRNRLELLKSCVSSLVGQEADSGNFEIIVVNDGSTDDTSQWLNGLPVGFVRSLSQNNRGAAAARNAGLHVAKGDIVIFVDDDVQPADGFVRAHLAAHGANPRCAVVGMLETVRGSDEASVESRFREAGARRLGDVEPGCILPPEHLLTGNCSFPAGLLRQFGGFDETLLANEDYELGLRLVNAGVAIRYWPEAAGVERFVRGRDLAFEGAYRRGVAQGLLARKHHAAFEHFALDRFFQGDAGTRMARSVAWQLAPVAPLFLSMVDRAFRAGLANGRWERVTRALSGFFYWAGVGRSMGRVAHLRDAWKRSGT